MSTEKTTYANCLCGAIKFTLKGEPFQYSICHCKNCRHASGSAFLAHAIFNTSLKMSDGAELITHYADSNTSSGNTLTRSFCSKCGSPLFLKPAQDGIILIHTGQIEETVTWVPKKEYYPHEKRAWLKEITIQKKKKPAKL